MARTAEGQGAHRVSPPCSSAAFVPSSGGAPWAAVAMVLVAADLRGRDRPADRPRPDRLARPRTALRLGRRRVAGLLLTAVPNWTGRLPVVGRLLAALVALWLAGRVAILASAPRGARGGANDLASPSRRWSAAR